jgi:hypothetical protein
MILTLKERAGQRPLAEAILALDRKTTALTAGRGFPGMRGSAETEEGNLRSSTAG